MAGIRSLQYLPLHSILERLELKHVNFLNPEPDYGADVQIDPAAVFTSSTLYNELAAFSTLVELNLGYNDLVQDEGMCLTGATDISRINHIPKGPPHSKPGDLRNCYSVQDCGSSAY